MLRTVLSFLTRRKPESAVKSEWKYVCLALHYCWMYREKTISKKDDLNDRYLCSSICICESAKRAAKHIILLSSTRFIAKTVWIETLMNTLKTTRKWKKQLLNTHLAYFPARRGLSRRGKIFLASSWETSACTLKSVRSPSAFYVMSSYRSNYAG